MLSDRHLRYLGLRPKGLECTLTAVPSPETVRSLVVIGTERWEVISTTASDQCDQYALKRRMFRDQTVRLSLASVQLNKRAKKDNRVQDQALMQNKTVKNIP